MSIIDGLELDELYAKIKRLEIALGASVKLQSHYANLLNMYDGGRRMEFADGDAWIERLKSTGDIPREYS